MNGIKNFVEKMMRRLGESGIWGEPRPVSPGPALVGGLCRAGGSLTGWAASARGVERAPGSRDFLADMLEYPLERPMNKVLIYAVVAGVVTSVTVTLLFEFMGVAVGSGIAGGVGGGVAGAVSATMYGRARDTDE